MTTTELLDIHTKLIQRYAYVALSKLKKPTISNVDDMYQEGILAFLDAVKSYDETRGACFKTHLTTCLKHHFSDLVTRSYRKKEVANSIHVEGLTSKPCTFEIVQMQFLLKNFTEDEIQYIDMIVSLVGVARRSRRKHTRAALSISYEREMALRRSIHDKIRK